MTDFMWFRDGSSHEKKKVASNASGKPCSEKNAIIWQYVAHFGLIF